MNNAILFAVLGGATIGTAALLLFAGLGRIAGISGIFAHAAQAPRRNLWAVWFVFGLGVGGWLARSLGLWDPGNRDLIANSWSYDSSALPWSLVGAVLVGFGTRLGSGCTSGHGVCGIARLSKRSLVATLVFLATGMLTATLGHAL